MNDQIKQVTTNEWEIPMDFVPGMRVPGRFFLSKNLAETLEDGALTQLANVATLPGILKYSLGMPDIHWGYGFPIGGVGAFDAETGIISPGGVGFDINCGVRMITTPLTVSDISDMKELVEDLFNAVPTGVGSKSPIRLSQKDLSSMLEDGAKNAVEMGYGMEGDIPRCEENGAMEGAKPEHVSKKARQRGIPQCGTLGSGNHFLEVQVVDDVVDNETAKTFGVYKGQICVMIHCGSRGLGHQVCTDHLQVLESAAKKYGIDLPDRQLACAPLSSPEGEAYFGAMAASANYAWANRQIITHIVRELFVKKFQIAYDEMPLVYDVAHNVAKWEEHKVDGVRRNVCVHRKGATRAFGPCRAEVPHEFRTSGQPVIIPGSMGTPSYILAGTDGAMEKTFGSTCHGSGRVKSRSSAKKSQTGEEVAKALLQQGIIVRAPNQAAIAEEAPDVYKPSSEVVQTVHDAGISRIVARMRPLGVIKG
ncbi:RtcB family protein [uncultured Methanocorpusculum sp.]|nr:RtcB family protein [uncultured Methanocorpusculum sp.]